LISGVKATLSQSLEKLEKDLGKHQFPTARVATQNTIMEYHVNELLRVLAKAKIKLDLISGEKDKENILKVGLSLEQLKVGLEVAKKAVIHEAEIAKVAQKHGMAVVEATEGQTTISKGLDERVQFMVSGIKKDRAYTAQINRGGGGGGGQRGGRGGWRSQRGARGRGGNRGRGGWKPSGPVTCYKCGQVGHKEIECKNK
jgi:hypothetical protein